MGIRKYVPVLLAVVLVLTLFLTACSKNDPQATGESNKGETQTPGNTGTETGEKAGKDQNGDVPPEKRDPVTLKYVTYFVGQYQKEFDMFHEKYPWITIEPIVNNDVLGTVVSMVAGGEAPDLAIVDNMTSFIKQDLLEELTPYIAKNEIIQTAKVRNNFKEIYKIDDKTYALPVSDVPYWIAVNKDMLEKHGMEMPSLDWTYEDFLEMAKKATDPSAGEYGLSNDSSFNYELAMIRSLANGSSPNPRFLNEDLSESVLQSPEVAADVQWVKDLVYKWHVRPTPEEAEKYGWDASNNFLAGKSLFGMGADWFVPGYNENANFEWDVLPMPTGTKIQATLHLNGPFAVMKASKHKEEAFLWLAFQFEMEAQKWMIDNASIAFVDDPELSSYYDSVDIWKDKNVDAIKRTAEICCYTKDPAVMDFEWYMTNVSYPLVDYFRNMKELSEVIPAAEQYKKIASDARNALELK